MIKIENTNTYVSGVFPDTVAVNSTGAGTQDGFEFVAGYINNSVIGPQQAWMDYAGLTPNGVTEAAGASQFIEAIQRGNGIGPGVYVQYAKADDPSVTGDRILLLSGQGVLRASYTDLDNAVYVGDPSNPTAPYFYHADDAAGTVRNTAGIYLILPTENPTYRRTYSQANGDFTVTGSSGWITTHAIASVYATVDSSGVIVWRMSFNLHGATSNVNSITTTWGGVIFASGPAQAVSGQNGTADFRNAATVSASSTIAGNSSSNGSQWKFTGDVELSGRPTFADDFNFPWGITY